MKKFNYLCYIIVLLALITTTVGIFYRTGGNSIFKENIYGDVIQLYGDGIYKNDSLMKASINRGTDVAMFIVTILFAIFTIIKSKSAKLRLIHLGLLSGLFYYSACLVFGVTFNSLFPIYVLLFSSTLFALIFLTSDIIKEDNIKENITTKSFKGTAIFLFICGSSVLMWLQFIVPAILTGKPMSNIEIYTTEPTFVLDLAIVLPLYYGTAIALLKKNVIGYKLTPVLLTFIVIIGLTVISQSLIQTSMGIKIPLQEFIGLIFSFIVLGIIACLINIRFLKYIK